VDINPLRSETDYEAALKKIEMLVNSQPGTPEGDRMDVLQDSFNCTADLAVYTGISSGP